MRETLAVILLTLALINSTTSKSPLVRHLLKRKAVVDIARCLQIAVELPVEIVGVMISFSVPSLLYVVEDFRELRFTCQAFQYLKLSEICVKGIKKMIRFSRKHLSIRSIIFRSETDNKRMLKLGKTITVSLATMCISEIN